MKINSFEPRRKRGFTLIELLTVMAIFAVLTAVLLPVYASATEAAKRTVCMSNLHQLAIGVNLYGASNDDKLPYALDRFALHHSSLFPAANYAAENQGDPKYQDFLTVLQPYLQDKNILRCPDDVGDIAGTGNDPFYVGPVWKNAGSSYCFRTVPSEVLSSVGSMVPLAMDGDPYHTPKPYGPDVYQDNNVVFLDGHARRVGSFKW